MERNLVLVFVALINPIIGEFVINEEFEVELKNGIFQPRGLGDVTNQLMSWLFIMPGTKWCGVGDKATSYEDLGFYQEEDSCCRQHDHCEDFIKPFQTKHGLFNTNTLYPKLHCNCDILFYYCLTSVNSTYSGLIGQIYFNTIGTQCFQKNLPVLKCRKYTTLPAIKCVDYQFDHTKPEKFQWFDVPNYRTAISNASKLTKNPFQSILIAYAVYKFK